jgi:hypothetical protein
VKDYMKNEKIYLGVYKDYGQVWMPKASWDCDWYWGFGYIQNPKLHTHLAYLDVTKNLYNAIKSEFKVFVLEDKYLWVFCELMQTFYHLKQTAEVLGRGGSHMTKNPLADLIKNPEEVHRINTIVLPKIFEEIYKLFEK